ncbi:MAG: arginase family protein [Deltaproteobacteria bacterium]|nr:arginase family protein [Deltaproteobacteria bacterium]
MEQPLTLINPHTFFGAPVCHNLDELNAQVGILGVPFDQGVNVPFEVPGGSQAPDVIRECSPTLFYDMSEFGLFDPDDGKEYVKGVKMADCGNTVIVGNDFEGNFNRITESFRKIITSGALAVAVGGDHSITYPLVKAFDQYESLDIIQFDAHLDFGDELFGAKYTNNSGIKRVRELPFVDNITAIGIRHTVKEEWDEAVAAGTRILTPRQIYKEGMTAAAERVIPESKYIYVTIDIDALDHSQAPGTTLAVPGGIDFEQMLEALKVICTKGRVVGFDITEVHPGHDLNKITTRLAAWIIARFIGYIFDQDG